MTASTTRTAVEDSLRVWTGLGAHRSPGGGVDFAVWAPNAQRVQVDGDFNGWDAARAVDLSFDPYSGRWSGHVPTAAMWDRYKYRILSGDGTWQLRADPMAFHTETPPASASVVFESTYVWGDQAWRAAHRTASDPSSSPMSVYEVHLPSWRPGLTYRELGEELVAHVADLGFTHVEFLPVMEHPYGGSWGYQTTGFFAPTSRLGTPDDLRHLIDRFHQVGIGVILDWVPAHFARDEWALAAFDGTALYEHPDPRRGEHPDWGSLIFDFGRPEVRDFLIASALYWIEEFHADGLRVDAVSSMLYLDYSRQPGGWEPNVFGGNGNLEAIDFLRALTGAVRRLHPGAVLIAEESAAWPGVSRPVEYGGLGFGLKWNLGWMHDTLLYLVQEPVFRRYHHDDLMRPTTYAFSEHYMLPLSHDEVVHGKSSLLSKMPGTPDEQVASLRALLAYQWAFPGKHLLFMGAEFAQKSEWSEQAGLAWADAAEPGARGVTRLVADLNAVYRRQPALWIRDGDANGTQWPSTDPAANTVAFIRFDHEASGDAVVCVANFSGVSRRDQRIGLPWPGTWTEILNTDAAEYNGTDEGNWGSVEAEDTAWDGQPASAAVTIAARSTIWLTSTWSGA